MKEVDVVVRYRAKDRKIKSQLFAIGSVAGYASIKAAVDYLEKTKGVRVVAVDVV